ncbi:endonuclease/exonuclease/phosphatase family protein [Streptomyces sp. NPDC057239]|uniref:endonuclease/exonuclease/phosphatase family protein n=1 Tax=Streptomyces sp. NPDC057239 TaxID=3346061 RepID=UPI0036382C40
MPHTVSPSPSFERRRRKGRYLAASATLLGIVSTVAVVQTAGPSRSSTPPQTLITATWNMCGVREWNCAGTGSRAAKKRELERLATRSGAEVILLQEACATDVEAVRRNLGPSWYTAFRPYTWSDRAGRTGTVQCGTAGPAGRAVLSAYPLSAVRTVPSRQPSAGVRRGILCVSVAAQDIRVCAAHLSPPRSGRADRGQELRDDQLNALAGAVPERRTVYGGDLNVDPPGEDNPDSWVWPDRPYRVHRECDQESDRPGPARATHVSRHKLDYLFTGLPVLECRVRDTGVSDHLALLIRVDTRTG